MILISYSCRVINIQIYPYFLLDTYNNARGIHLVTKKFDPTMDIDVRATMRLIERKRMIRINY
jgi:hypothetical protein